jgi:hypothetical protein
VAVDPAARFPHPSQATKDEAAYWEEVRRIVKQIEDDSFARGRWRAEAIKAVAEKGQLQSRMELLDANLKRLKESAHPDDVARYSRFERARLNPKKKDP